MPFDKERFRAAFRTCIAGRTLRTLEPEIGISMSTISRISRGENPDIDSFAAIVAWMHADANQFFTENGSDEILSDKDELLLRIGYALYSTSLPEEFNEAVLTVIRLILDR